MMLQPRYLLILALVIKMLWSTMALAGPVSCGDRPISLAFYEYGFLYDNGRGIDKDIVDLLAKRTGCRFETKVMPRARIWSDLAHGSLDMTVSGIQTSERDRFAWFAAYLSMKNHALVHASAASQIRSAETFLAQTSLQFGVVRAFRHGVDQDRWLDQLRREKRVQESPDIESVMRKLKEHRIAAAFSQPPVYRKLLKEMDMVKEVVVQDWTPAERGVPHGLVLAKSRFSAAEAARWQELVNRMRADGSLRAIYGRYLPAAEAARLLDF